jgi:hypothetical protein
MWCWLKRFMFLCGGDRTQTASLKHKNFTLRTFRVSGTERPDSCIVSLEVRRCHVSQIQESFSRNRSGERHSVICLFVLFLVKETTLKIFVVSFRTFCLLRQHRHYYFKIVEFTTSTWTLWAVCEYSLFIHVFINLSVFNNMTRYIILLRTVFALALSFNI